MLLTKKLFQMGRLTMANNQSTISLMKTSFEKRQLHSNRASICRLKRNPNEYQRLYPVWIIYRDGSAVLVRHHVPRELIKLPLKLEDCESEQEKMEWRSRRKQKEVIRIKKDDTDIQFDRSQYIRMATTSNKPQTK